jgi:hypothetical protein
MTVMTMQKIDACVWQQGVKIVPYAAKRGTTPKVHP